MLELRTPAQAAAWLRKRNARALHSDSRKVRAGDGFIAWPGAATDARRHVASALNQGASACLVEHAGVEGFGFKGEALASYLHLKANCGPIAAAFYGDPSQQIEVLAITGTNGKTSTAWWLAQGLTHVAASGCALIGTLGAGQPPHLDSTGLTTPDPILLQRTLRGFADAGLRYCAIEASSIGIVERRLDGTLIRVAVFTNFTQDHLDYHGDMQAYWRAKSALFGWPGLRAAVLNVDDVYGAQLAASLATSGLDLWTVSLHAGTRIVARDIGYTEQGIAFTVQEGDLHERISTALIGSYNVSNLLGVIATLRALGISLKQAAAACTALTPVPGRMEQISAPGCPLVAVDYAHTPDALNQALRALRPLAQQRKGRLWCVFGCGGNRDATKRPLMAAVAEQGADQVVVTSDNPRDEKPEAIVSQILLGLSRQGNVHVQVDRALAIAQTIAQAAPQDIVLIAGKGHEAYQEVVGLRHVFADQDHARTALAARSQVPQAPAALSVQQLHEWLPGSRLMGDGSVAATRVHSDTRTLRLGDLFVALKGEQFNGNTMIADALTKGAVAALAHRGALPAGSNGVEVDDTRIALGQLARAWRRQHQLPLIAVTGSNGKTTVTQMIASILHAYKGEAALATRGNLNNDIGVPLTLLLLRPEHQIAVLELGMNHPGEIAYLADIARPTVALVNNAQREHLEFMGSVDAVAQENGSVISALGDGGVAVFPADDVHASLWRTLSGTRQCLTFGESEQADVRLQGAQWRDGHWQVQVQTPAGALQFPLHIAGRHNLRNALAAIACALAANVPMQHISAGLAQFVPVKGRSRAFVMQSGARAITVVDDTYNANPDSMRAAIDVLADLPRPRLAVLGDMGEVGSGGPAFHAEAGVYARASGIDLLFTMGEQAKGMGGRHFADLASLNAAVLAELPNVGSVLVKGSRFMKMERVIEAITAVEGWSCS